MPRWCSGLSSEPVELGTRIQIPFGALFSFQAAKSMEPKLTACNEKSCGPGYFIPRILRSSSLIFVLVEDVSDELFEYLLELVTLILSEWGLRLYKALHPGDIGLGWRTAYLDVVQGLKKKLGAEQRA